MSTLIVTSEINEAFHKVVHTASSFRSALEIPHEPPQDTSDVESDIARQWVWQTMIVAEAVQEASPEDMLMHISKVFDQSPDIRGSVFGVQMGLMGHGKKLIEEGQFPDIPAMPPEFLTQCDR